MAFQILAASQEESQKNSKKCLLPCLLLILYFSLVVQNGVKNKEKTTISCGFPVELIAGFVRSRESATEQRLFAAGAIASRYFGNPAITTKKKHRKFVSVFRIWS